MKDMVSDLMTIQGMLLADNVEAALDYIDELLEKVHGSEAEGTVDGETTADLEDDLPF
jgi:hypothetical protein